MSALLSFIMVAASPVGGMLAAVPLGILGLGYPPWAVVVACVPLGYLQVLAVDLGWDALERVELWRRLRSRPRGAMVHQLLSHCGGFWSTAALVPLVGPWAVMGLMRTAGVPQRRVAFPILFALTVIASLLGIVCAVAPEWVR
ncbi:hypothetical protein MYSTI_05622 [Myxococcus stipitatus DSM 14675]|uniref:Small multi-drug export protein n=1 Tax=Myxococcus stipitatus (strain DSM 14675 / JCM 12634 / Mx s8) TaxID=1278073 RepID=L7UKB2_MYXSD|nr:hypothetical protein [Myxococcus stipitatus]AGC46899.1 hypothetical protein MYSTI_05622 [Myxococcus stipitatus DSM 14675]